MSKKLDQKTQKLQQLLSLSIEKMSDGKSPEDVNIKGSVVSSQAKYDAVKAFLRKTNLAKESEAQNHQQRQYS